MSRWALLLSVSVLAMSAPALAACSGKGANAATAKKIDLDADPLALLPASPVIVANLDMRAILDGDSAGAQVATLVTKYAPLGADAGFDAHRDVDRVALASYATGGLDLVAVLSGRFDEEKIARVTTTPQGGAIVRGTYAEHATYTAGNIEYAVLTSKTLVAGYGDAFRRLLDRVHAGSLDRSIPPWMAQTIETQGAPMAAAADFQTQPAFAAALGSVNLDWLKGLQIARVVGNLAPPGVNIAATLSYSDPGQAQAAAEGVRTVDHWLNMLGPLIGGVQLQNFEVVADAKDLKCKFALDDRTLRAVLALAPRFLTAPP